MNDSNTFQKDVLAGGDFDMVKLRSDFLTWWYNLLTFFFAFLLMTATIGYAVMLLVQPGMWQDLLDMPLIIKINFAVYYLLSFWMVLSVVLSWYSWKYAMDWILICASVFIVFVIYMWTASVGLKSPVNTLGLTIVLVTLSILVWRATVIREDWRNGTRKANVPAGMEPFLKADSLPARSSLLPWWMHVVMSVLTAVHIICLISCFAYFAEIQEGPDYVMPREEFAGFSIILFFLIFHIAGCILLWYSWKHAVGFTIIPSVGFGLLSASFMLMFDSELMMVLGMMIPYFLLQSFLIVRLLRIHREWKRRPRKKSIPLELS